MKCLQNVLVALCFAGLAGCTGTPGALVGARDNTLFAEADSPHLVVMTDGGDAEVRTLRGERVRTLLKGNSGLSDVDDRGLRVVGRDSVGAFAAVAGQPVRRLELPIEWTANLTLNGSGTRIAATNGAGGQLRVLSFDSGETLSTRECPPAASCVWVGWDLEEPDVVWFIGKAHDGFVRLNLDSGESALRPRDSQLPIRLPSQNALWQTTCKATGAQLVTKRDAIDLVESGKLPRRVVVVEGSRQPWGFTERFPPIRSAGFLEGCRYAVFTYFTDYYLLDIATGAIGRLSGVPIRSLPSIDSPDAHAAR
jgi:hypothetical protein